MFLMPSLFEPCGIGQLIAMRYGSIPIVRETGGLKDTVIPYNKYTGEGNGFSFANYNAHEMLYCIQNAINYIMIKKLGCNLVNNAMNTDSSWKKSAKEYIEVYEDIVNHKGVINIDAQSIKMNLNKDFERKMYSLYAQSIKEANNEQLLNVLCTVIKDYISKKWVDNRIRF